MATQQDKYYTEMLEIQSKWIIKKGKPLSNKRLRQEVINVLEELDAEHLQNINNITCNDSYRSLMKKKDVSTINDFVYYESDEHLDMISDSDKQVDYTTLFRSSGTTHL